MKEFIKNPYDLKKTNELLVLIGMADDITNNIREKIETEFAGIDNHYGIETAKELIEKAVTQESKKELLRRYGEIFG